MKLRRKKERKQEGKKPSEDSIAFHHTERPGDLSTKQRVYLSANIGRPVDISQDNVRCDGFWGRRQIQHDSQRVGNQWGVYLQANKPWSVVQPSCHVNGLRR